MDSISSQHGAQAYRQHIMGSIQSYGIPIHSIGSKPHAHAQLKWNGIHWILLDSYVSYGFLA